MPPLLTEQFHTGGTHHSASQKKKRRKEREEVGWSPPPRRRKPRAGELSAGRALGSRQPVSITYLPSFEPAPAPADGELREGSAGRQTGKTDSRAGRAGGCRFRLVSNGEVGRLRRGFCNCISSTSRSLREPARAWKRDNPPTGVACVSTRHWTRLLTALRSPGTRLKVSPGQLVG